MWLFTFVINTSVDKTVELESSSLLPHMKELSFEWTVQPKTFNYWWFTLSYVWLTCFHLLAQCLECAEFDPEVVNKYMNDYPLGAWLGSRGGLYYVNWFSVWTNIAAALDIFLRYNWIHRRLYNNQHESTQQQSAALFFNAMFWSFLVAHT